MQKVTVVEPVFVAQTAEPEHMATEESRRAWVDGVIEEAKKAGATYPRLTWRPDGSALLFEAWDRMVTEEEAGAQRWAVTAET